MNKHVIKSSGLVELFSLQKLEKSIQKSLLSAGEQKSSDIDSIVGSIREATTNWLANKNEVSVADIRSFVYKQLLKHNKSASVVYKNHKELW